MEYEFFFQPSYDKLITGTESLSTICKFINHLVWVWYWLKNTDPDTPKNTDITDTRYRYLYFVPSLVTISQL